MFPCTFFQACTSRFLWRCLASHWSWQWPDWTQFLVIGVKLHMPPLGANRTATRRSPIDLPVIGGFFRTAFYLQCCIRCWCSLFNSARTHRIHLVRCCSQKTMLFHALISIFDPFIVWLIVKCPRRHPTVNHSDLAEGPTLLLSYSHHSNF